MALDFHPGARGVFLPSEIGLKVLLTGAHGFLGGRVLQRLLERGIEVAAVLRESSEPAFRQRFDVPTIRSGSFGAMDESIREWKPTLLIHCAALPVMESSRQNFEAVVDSNFNFGLNVLESAITSGCRRVINCSTYWQLNEAGEVAPNSLYAALKQGFETCLDFYAARSEGSAVSLRLYDVMGENDPRPKLIQKIFQSPPDARIPLSGGEQVISPIYVGDVVRAIETVMDDPSPGKGHVRYSVSGEFCRLKDFIEKLVAHRGLLVHLDWGQLPYAKLQIQSPYRGNVLPNWKPQLSTDALIQLLARNP